MKRYLPMSIAVGIIAVIWVFLADVIGFIAWPGFIGWSIYFYGGAKPEALKKGVPCYILGALLAWLAVMMQGWLGGLPILVLIPIFLLSFLMTYAQTWDFFNLAPATFLGSATFFGTMNLSDTLLVGLAGMIILGLVSTWLIPMVENWFNHRSRVI